jgi:hypothetical protein
MAFCKYDYQFKLSYIWTLWILLDWTAPVSVLLIEQTPFILLPYSFQLLIYDVVPNRAGGKSLRYQTVCGFQSGRKTWQLTEWKFSFTENVFQKKTGLWNLGVLFHKDFKKRKHTFVRLQCVSRTALSTCNVSRKKSRNKVVFFWRKKLYSPTMKAKCSRPKMHYTECWLTMYQRLEITCNLLIHYSLKSVQMKALQSVFIVRTSGCGFIYRPLSNILQFYLVYRRVSLLPDLNQVASRCVTRDNF